MAIKPSSQWQNASSTLEPRKFICGHFSCGREVGSKEGWSYHERDMGFPRGWIYICPMCHRPTFFDDTDDTQIPGVNFGRSVENLPGDIAKLYEEIRDATGIGSDTLAVLGCRKMLMHIAVENGAKEGLGFIDYVWYLVDQHFAPPGSKPWVDKIRTRGNEATHEIKIMVQEEARELVNFVEMLLKFIYEFPAKIGTPQQTQP